MAKRKKVLPARKQRDRSRDDESLFMRSAETLGRMIGTLQRQLDGATKSARKSVKRATGAGKTTATRKRTARKATPTRKRTARKSTKKR